MHGYSQNKDDYLNRLRRIEGQVRGLQRMIEEDQYCIDILTQVAAATKALQAVALGLLEEHLGHCVAQAVAEGGDTASAKVREASEAEDVRTAIDAVPLAARLFRTHVRRRAGKSRALPQVHLAQR